jgi:hypothetical protein
MDGERKPGLTGAKPGPGALPKLSLAGSPTGKPIVSAAAPPKVPAYEFAESGPAKPTEKKPEAKPGAKAPAKPFNPFDQPVQVPLGATAPTAPAAPTAPTVPTGPAPSVPPPAAAPAPSASAAAEADADQDIKPGSGKDLWPCPHCGAKNKPARTTCRLCGKDPHEAVVVPWHQQPLVRAGLAAVVAIVVVILYFALRADLSLHPAGPNHIDDKVRLGGSAGAQVELGENRIFYPTGVLSVSGRILAAQPHHTVNWISTVVVAMTRQVCDDAIFNTWTTEIKDDAVTVSGSPKYVVLQLIFAGDQKPELKRGDYLSVLGEVGSAQEDATLKGNEYAGAYVVKVGQFRKK